MERELEALKQEGWVVVEKIEKGRFRRSYGLRAVWERTPWAEERENFQQHGGPTVRTSRRTSSWKKVKGATVLRKPRGQWVNEPVND